MNDFDFFSGGGGLSNMDGLLTDECELCDPIPVEKSQVLPEKIKNPFLYLRSDQIIIEKSVEEPPQNVHSNQVEMVEENYQSGNYCAKQNSSKFDMDNAKQKVMNIFSKTANFIKEKTNSFTKNSSRTNQNEGEIQSNNEAPLEKPIFTPFTSNNVYERQSSEDKSAVKNQNSGQDVFEMLDNEPVNEIKQQNNNNHSQENFNIFNNSENAKTEQNQNKQNAQQDLLGLFGEYHQQDNKVQKEQFSNTNQQNGELFDLFDNNNNNKSTQQKQTKDDLLDIFDDSQLPKQNQQQTKNDILNVFDTTSQSNNHYNKNRKNNNNINAPKQYQQNKWNPFSLIDPF